MAMHEKIAQNRTIFSIWERPLEATVPHVMYFRKLFARTSFPLQIVCLYFELFKINTVSKLTILKKADTEIQRIWNYCGYPWGPPPHAIHFQKDLSRLKFASPLSCIILEVIKVQR